LQLMLQVSHHCTTPSCLHIFGHITSWCNTAVLHQPTVVLLLLCPDTGSLSSSPEAQSLASKHYRTLCWRKIGLKRTEWVSHCSPRQDLVSQPGCGTGTCPSRVNYKNYRGLLLLG
jgi:hypothetical protein